MKFSFYRADALYCDYLRKSDPCVPYTMDQKEARPFIGIVLTLNDYDYYAPLTSPKPKHLHMKNQVDFLKINGGVWGAINFNNMIPIHSDQLEHIDIRILPTDDKATVDYKNLLANQLSWCNTSANAASIIQKAEKLYRIITSKTGIQVKAGYQLAFLSPNSQQVVVAVLADNPKILLKEAQAKTLRQAETDGRLTALDAEEALGLSGEQLPHRTKRISISISEELLPEGAKQLTKDPAFQDALTAWIRQYIEKEVKA